MLRYLGSAILAMLTLFLMFFGLSKVIAPATSGVLAIIGSLDLVASPDAEAGRGDDWCREQPNETLETAESFRELCDAARDDCGPACQRVSTTQWSEDCSSHSKVSVCVPKNPLLEGRSR